MLSLLFARRYLFSSKSRSVINLIATLSVVAVAMPVAAMIILLSVFNGFEQLIRSNYSVFDADLRISPTSGQSFLLEELDTARIGTVAGVEAYSAILEQQILMEGNDRQATTTLRGVDPNYPRVVALEPAIVSGTSRVELGELDRLLIGQTMAYQLGVRSLADRTMYLYALRRGSFSTLVPMGNYTRARVEVEGIFAADYADESGYVIAPLRLAQRLLERPGRASALLVGCREGQVGAVQQALQEQLGEAFRVENRDQLRASFYRLMNYEKWGVFFIALLVLLVASFSVIGALSMLILEKRDERITLRAMGATHTFIRAIFRHEGYLICGLGALLGLLLGVGLTLGQAYFGWIEIPATSFLTQSYPVELHVGDLVLVLLTFAGVAWGLSTLTVRTMIKNKE